MDENNSANQNQIPQVPIQDGGQPNSEVVAKPEISEFASPLQKPRPDPLIPSTPLKINEDPENENGGMIKKIIFGVIIVIIIILAFIFWPKGQPQKVKLVWWGLWEDQSVISPIIADFEKQNPSVTVEYSVQDTKQYRERLLTRIQNNTGPDIFRFHNTWYPMLSEVLLPFSSDVVTQDQFKKTFYPVMQNDLIHNGAIYGMPLGADTISLFVNTELLDAAGVKPPTTWDDFVKAAKKLTVKDAEKKIITSGAALGTYDNVTHAPDIISLLFAQQGVNLNDLSTSVQDQTDAINFYSAFASGVDNTWDSTLDSSLIAFSQGKLAMYFGYSWDIFAIQKLNKGLPFKTYPVPSLFNRNMTIASYWAEGVSAKSAHQKEALLFIKYLGQKETAQKFYTLAAKSRGFGEPYARVDLADSLKTNVLIYPFVSQLKNDTSTVF
jgi:multiple sugar transport system substrate-binding protein